MCLAALTLFQFGSLKRNQSNAGSLAQIESRLSNLTALGRQLDVPENGIGTLGLNLLNIPVEPLIDFIFCPRSAWWLTEDLGAIQMKPIIIGHGSGYLSDP